MQDCPGMNSSEQRHPQRAGTGIVQPKMRRKHMLLARYGTVAEDSSEFSRYVQARKIICTCPLSRIVFRFPTCATLCTSSVVQDIVHVAGRGMVPAANQISPQHTPISGSSVWITPSSTSFIPDSTCIINLQFEYASYP
jgi:hypothetical protein